MPLLSTRQLYVHDSSLQTGGGVVSVVVVDVVVGPGVDGALRHGLVKQKPSM